MPDTHALIERLYTLFNTRELEEAAVLFADDALIEHGAPGRQRRGSASARVLDRKGPDLS